MNIDEPPLSRLRDETMLFDADLTELCWETLLRADERASAKNHRTVLV
jgi:hypothetical protein